METGKDESRILRQLGLSIDFTVGIIGFLSIRLSNREMWRFCHSDPELVNSLTLYLWGPMFKKSDMFKKSTYARPPPPIRITPM